MNPPHEHTKGNASEDHYSGNDNTNNDEIMGTSNPTRYSAAQSINASRQGSAGAMQRQDLDPIPSLQQQTNAPYPPRQRSLPDLSVYPLEPSAYGPTGFLPANYLSTQNLANHHIKSGYSSDHASLGGHVEAPKESSMSTLTHSSSTPEISFNYAAYGMPNPSRSMPISLATNVAHPGFARSSSATLGNPNDYQGAFIDPIYPPYFRQSSPAFSTVIRTPNSTLVRNYSPAYDQVISSAYSGRHETPYGYQGPSPLSSARYSRTSTNYPAMTRADRTHGGPVRSQHRTRQIPKPLEHRRSSHSQLLKSRRKPRKHPASSLRARLVATILTTWKSIDHWKPIIVGLSTVAVMVIALCLFFLIPRKLSVQIIGIQQESNAPVEGEAPTGANAFTITMDPDNILVVAATSGLQVRISNPNWAGATINGARMRAVWLLDRDRSPKRALFGSTQVVDPFTVGKRSVLEMQFPLYMEHRADPSDDAIYRDFLFRCLDPGNKDRRKISLAYEVAAEIKVLGKTRQIESIYEQEMPCPLDEQRIGQLLRQLKISYRSS